MDQILNSESTRKLLSRYRRDYVAEVLRRVLGELREQLLDSDGRNADTRDALAARIQSMLAAALDAGDTASIHRVINATGVVLHTGLGRAPLPASAAAAVRSVAESYCNLELDLQTGARGSRLTHVEELVRELSGSEAAAVVNNNAGAVLLMLSALARGRQVIVSRGELVEIGGSFRIPDIIEASGAVIREVGTTNRTHLIDYERALGAETAMILAVHPSNYRVEGFTSAVDLGQLAELGHRAGIPVAYDLGGGALADLAAWGLPPEPVVSESLATGVDLVSFSGDKVLGGPQAGIIAGSARHLDPIRKHPMMRALRCDKLTLAALEATLKLYRLPEAQMAAEQPVLRMLSESVERVQARAERVLGALSARAGELLCPRIEATAAQAGSGALPMEELPSRALSLTPRFCGAEELARRLRLRAVPVVGRVQKEKLLLDLRTVYEEDVESLVTALEGVVPAEDT